MPIKGSLKAINENVLAKKVVAEEGGEYEISIAQIKEIMRIHKFMLANEYSVGQWAAYIDKARVR
jgi:D-Tyr-tRNAtyr deacylase